MLVSHGIHGKPLLSMQSTVSRKVVSKTIFYWCDSGISFSQEEKLVIFKEIKSGFLKILFMVFGFNELMGSLDGNVILLSAEKVEHLSRVFILALLIEINGKRIFCGLYVCACA